MTWRWPLWYGPSSLPDAPGRFGAVRKHDIHTGVDLYTYSGMPVLAVEEGIVVGREHFTGAAVGSPWWNDTDALLVEGASGVVCYGEIAIQRGITLGSQIRREDFLGEVRTVLRKDKGRPMTMLHLELYEAGVRETVHWPLDEEQPVGLRDPTPFLEEVLRAHDALL